MKKNDEGEYSCGESLLLPLSVQELLESQLPMSVVRATFEAMRAGNYQRSLPPDSFPEIAQLLLAATDDNDRKLCYWMLADVAIATGLTEIGIFALERFALEKKAPLKKEALNVILWTHGITEYGPLLEALPSAPRLMSDILQALGACVGEESETALLGVLRQANSPRDIGNAGMAATSLARIASPDAVKQLEELFPNLPRKNPWSSVLAPILFALARHPSDSITELVRREVAATKMGQVGWAGLHYLAEHGTADDAKIATEYLAELLRKLARGSEVLSYSITHLKAKHATELAACVAILTAQMPSRLADFIPQLRKCWSSLPAHDQKLLMTVDPAGFVGLE